MIDVVSKAIPHKRVRGNNARPANVLDTLRTNVTVSVSSVNKKATKPKIVLIAIHATNTGIRRALYQNVHLEINVNSADRKDTSLKVAISVTSARNMDTRKDKNHNARLLANFVRSRATKQ